MFIYVYVLQSTRDNGLYIGMSGDLRRRFQEHQAGETSSTKIWLFPAGQISRDPESGVMRRHHLHDKVYSEAIKRGARAAGIEKRVTSHHVKASLTWLNFSATFTGGRGEFTGDSGAAGA